MSDERIDRGEPGTAVGAHLYEGPATGCMQHWILLPAGILQVHS